MHCFQSRCGCRRFPPGVPRRARCRRVGGRRQRGCERTCLYRVSCAIQSCPNEGLAGNNRRQPPSGEPREPFRGAPFGIVVSRSSGQRRRRPAGLFEPSAPSRRRAFERINRLMPARGSVRRTRHSTINAGWRRCARRWARPPPPAGGRGSHRRAAIARHLRRAAHRGGRRARTDAVGRTALARSLEAAGSRSTRRRRSPRGTSSRSFGAYHVAQRRRQLLPIGGSLGASQATPLTRASARVDPRDDPRHPVAGADRRRRPDERGVRAAAIGTVRRRGPGAAARRGGPGGGPRGDRHQPARAFRARPAS